MIALRHQTGATPARPDHLPSHAARDLTAGGTQAQIELDGQIYTLRITRAGKLILTK
jgi:hemin uptake protein HemP